MSVSALRPEGPGSALGFPARSDYRIVRPSRRRVYHLPSVTTTQRPPTCLPEGRRRGSTPLVLLANGRGHRKNLVEPLRNGVQAMRMPTGDWGSQWAYRVMATLAWTFQAWFALLLPEKGGRGEKYRVEKTGVVRLEFKTFLNALVRICCQMVRAGRRLWFYWLSWNP